ncbi:MAG TPA: GxxExxY protein [Planctomycetota bacterium]|nr:GxxExxY protein [Planctomycetota bacterium]
MTENELSKVIVDAAYKVHTALGPGLLESAYHGALLYELRKRKLKVQTKVQLPVRYEEVDLGIGYEMDLLVEDLVVVELKAVEEIHPVHKRQLFTYLKLSGKRLGLLINFGDVLIKDGISRVVNGLKE